MDLYPGGYPARYGRFAGGIVAGNQKLLATIVWPHFTAIQIVLLVIIFNYCVIRELGRAIGEERLLRMFFRQPAGEVLGGLERGGAAQRLRERP